MVRKSGNGDKDRSCIQSGVELLFSTICPFNSYYSSSSLGLIGDLAHARGSRCENNKSNRQTGWRAKRSVGWFGDKDCNSVDAMIQLFRSG